MKITLPARTTSHQVASKHSWLWLYATLIITWIAFCITIAAFFISTSLKEAQSSFYQYSDAYSEHLDDKVSGSQLILEGFAALFGALGNTDSHEAASYARQVTENHPHIFALEIAQTVPQAGLANFLQQQRNNGHSNFQIRTFGYRSDKKWHAVADKPVYYPIVFMAPMRPESEEVFGLDMGSVPFLSQAILESIKKQHAVSSRPFHLVQGHLGYVIFMPVRAMSHTSGRHEMPATSPYTVDMVVDAAKITTPDNMSLPRDQHLVVYHSSFEPEDPAG